MAVEVLTRETILKEVAHFAAKLVDDQILPPPPQVRAKPKILTMGGCNLKYALDGLSQEITHRHIWRASFPSLVSEPIFLKNSVFASASVSKFFARETQKTALKSIENSDSDVIFFECAGDFAFNFLRFGNCIITDMRSANLGPEFAELEYGEDTELHRPDEVLSPDLDAYWEHWSVYFDKMYREVFRPKINAGTKLIYLSRRLCLLHLSDNKKVPFHNVDVILKRNKRLAEVDLFVRSYPGITIIPVDDDLLYSSPRAPYGGPSAFHPEEAYYSSIRHSLLSEIFPRSQRAGQFVSNSFAEADSVRNRLLDDVAERDRLLREADGRAAILESEIRDLKQLIIRASASL